MKSIYEELSKVVPLHMVTIEMNEKARKAGLKSLPLPGYDMPLMMAETFADYLDAGKVTYRIGYDFGKDLQGTKVDNLTAAHLPVVNAFIAIDFPDSVNLSLLGGRVPGVFVNVIGGTNKALLIFAPIWNETMHHWEFKHDVLRTHDSNEPLDVALQRERENFKNYDEMTELRTFVINCLLYINSGDPDLRHLRAPRPPATKDVKTHRIWNRKHDNDSLIDVTLVGYNHMKAVEYSVSGTTVRGHRRWQPFGEGRTQVKWIWIAAHERKYKNVKEELI